MNNPTTIQALYLVGEDTQGHEVLRHVLAQPFESAHNESERMDHPIALLVAVVQNTGQIRTIVVTRDNWWTLV